MTDPRDTLKRAADELRHVICIMPEDDSHLKDLADALDRMAEQEPVAVRKWHDEFKCWNYDDIEDVLPTHSGEHLYAAPGAPADDATGADWEVAADNWKAVVAFCRQHPGESVTILAVPAVPEDDALTRALAEQEPVAWMRETKAPLNYTEPAVYETRRVVSLNPRDGDSPLFAAPVAPADDANDALTRALAEQEPWGYAALFPSSGWSICDVVQYDRSRKFGHPAVALYAAPVAPAGDATGADWEVAAQLEEMKNGAE